MASATKNHSIAPSSRCENFWKADGQCVGQGTRHEIGGACRGIVNYLLCLGLLALLWKLVASALSVPFLLPPETVLRNFAHACTTADFWAHFLVSAFRVVSGIFLGWFLAFPVGVMMGYGKRLDTICAPCLHHLPCPENSLASPRASDFRAWRSF